MKKQTFICENCGAEFIRYYGCKQRGCSKKCVTAIWYRDNGQTPPEPIKSKCAVCGKEFEWNRRGHNQIYCSKACQHVEHMERQREKRRNTGECKSLRSYINAKCPGCGQWWKAKINYIGTGTPRFFCDACRHRNERILYSPYNQSAETRQSA
jgi:endogenous inhibitor of DNA gyrase (YacG/DUF329 family)